MAIVKVTDSNFDDNIQSGVNLVDFWATWCGPCRMQAPILDQLEQEYDEEEFRIAKMDVDENPETPQQFGIMSIPTLMLKKDGQVVEKAVGVHSKEQLRQMIDQYL